MAAAALFVAVGSLIRRRRGRLLHVQERIEAGEAVADAPRHVAQCQALGQAVPVPVSVARCVILTRRRRY